MKFTEKPMERITVEAEDMIKEISTLEPVSISKLDSGSTMAVFVDIINGFINEGAMASERVGDIIPENARLLKICNEKGILTTAFADCHEKNAAEFASFPPHCVKGTRESEIVEELKEQGGYILIPKNSTNGFNEQKFRDLIECHPEICTFIVTGDCTDICVLQFCLALKTYFTAQDRLVKIIVPISCVETYDAPFHSSDFANLAAYKLLKDSGITFVSGISG
ncbi:MAG: cysteine hydrolase [Oscillospiraceae bacterium]|nr:cysteine hydrolase [Oscillospiraceae bacterium]MBQ5332670.1 cysteine hydrolase [Oscillospiraceae bacterium]